MVYGRTFSSTLFAVIRFSETASKKVYTSLMTAITKAKLPAKNLFY